MAGKNDLDTKGLEAVKFGEEIRKSEFCLRPGSTFINNGSYGTVPRRVLDVQKRYLDQFESHPDHWLRRTVRGGWDEARQVVADFVGADVEDVVFVMNATTGVNTVLRSYRLSPGDAIVATSLSYGALKNLWMEFVESICPGVELLFLEIKMPITSEDDLVQQFDDFFAQHTNIKFALIDHISSPSSILMPVKRLAQVCRKHGAMVIVDGAHAPGQVHLNLKELDVDFYSGNMHKWVYTPRGSAFLWVRREHHATVRPPIMSWAKGMSLSEQFFVQGTRDHIPFLCAKHGLQFYQAIGGMDKVVGYTSHLATVGRDLLAEELGLDRLDIPPSMEAPNLRMLKLPGVPQSCSGIKDKRLQFVCLVFVVFTLHQNTSAPLLTQEFPVSVTMKWLSALLLCVVVCAVSGELINVLHQLQESDTFHQLSVQDKIYLTDIIAASETCKLTALVNDIGRDTVVRVVSHLPDVEKQKIQTYLTNHKNAEADGTCVVQ